MDQTTINTSTNFEKNSGLNKEMEYPINLLRNFSRESCTAAFMMPKGSGSVMAIQRDKLSTQPANLAPTEHHKQHSSLINNF